MTPAGGTVTLFPLPSGWNPGELLSADGKLWVVDQNQSDSQIFSVQP